MRKELVLGVILGASALAAPGFAETQTAAAPPTPKGTEMIRQASGTFEVKVMPLAEDEKVPGVSVGRMSIDKQFKGDLEGTSKGEMMTASTSVKGSAGYVAVEVVTASLKGRTGSFTLLHQATMKQDGDFKMSLVVIPDSGTGELAGLGGSMTIIIEGGKHSYQLDYTLSEVR
jgi:hypothetical protein